MDYKTLFSLNLDDTLFFFAFGRRCDLRIVQRGPSFGGIPRVTSNPVHASDRDISHNRLVVAPQVRPDNVHTSEHLKLRRRPTARAADNSLSTRRPQHTHEMPSAERPQSESLGGCITFQCSRNELKHSDFGVVSRHFCPPFECTLAAGAVQRFLLQHDVLASSLKGHSETGWQTPRVRLETHRCVSGNCAPVGALCGHSSKATGLRSFGAVKQRSELREEATWRLNSDRRAGSICTELLHHGCIPRTTLPP